MLPCDMKTGIARRPRYTVSCRLSQENDPNSPGRKNNMKPAASLFLIPLGLMSAGAGPSIAETARPALPQSRSRIEASALIESLNRRLLESQSATATLEAWCADHCMARPAKIVARRIAGIERTPDPETRRRLGAVNGETVRYRHVQLMCGEHILSEADNWYVPARLPAEANIMLETGDTPFGKAIRSLRPTRLTISAEILWAPPTAVASASDEINPPRYLVEHRALVLTQDRTPVSEVDERYTREVLDFGECQAPEPPTH